MPLPPEHVKFYRQTVVRLIKANELPQSAMKQFDEAFSMGRQAAAWDDLQQMFQAIFKL